MTRKNILLAGAAAAAFFILVGLLAGILAAVQPSDELALSFSRSELQRIVALEQRVAALEATVYGTTTTTQKPTTTTTTTAPTTTTTKPPTTTTAPSTTTTTKPPTTTTQATTTTTSPGGQTPSGSITMASGRTYQNLAITAGSIGMRGDGLSNVNISNVSIKGGEYGMKVGGGPVSSGFIVDRLTVNGGETGIYLDDVHDSVFTNLDVTSPKISSNQVHAMYLESDVVNVTFRNSTFRGGSGYTVHIYHGTGADESEPGVISKNITFENCIIDARNGRYPLVIGEGCDNIIFRGCTFYGTDGQIFLFYGGSNILIEDFVAYGTDDLIDGDCESAIIRNGTYYGPKIGSASGVTVQNVVLK